MSVELSIIVPAYNVEKYLEPCIESILKNTFREFEVLLVDDGSTDATPELCDRLVLLDTRITVIHQSNQGLSAARNTGLARATGKFIIFVDSDDLISTTMFSTLLSAIEAASADIAMCQFRRVSRQEMVCECPSVDQVSKFTIIKNQALIWEDVLCGVYNFCVWNKCYRKSILDRWSIRFDENCGCGEDLFFNADYLKHCKTVVTVGDTLYYYVMNEGSIMNSFRENRFVGEKYMGLPRSWRYVADVVRNSSEGLAMYAHSRASMFYQTVLRKLEKPSPEYIAEAVAYVRKYKAALLRYRWGWKYYLSAVILSINCKLWASIFRRNFDKR